VCACVATVCGDGDSDRDDGEEGGQEGRQRQASGGARDGGRPARAVEGGAVASPVRRSARGTRRCGQQ
jgi:hypothetical protein